MNRDTIKRLKPGTHTLTIESMDGKATTTFTVKEPQPLPKTGDNANIGLWTLLLLTAALAIIWIVKKSHKHC